VVRIEKIIIKSLRYSGPKTSDQLFELLKMVHEGFFTNDKKFYEKIIKKMMKNKKIWIHQNYLYV